MADFGLAASMDLSKDYYRQDEEVLIKLPIKWMSPESILDNIFSEKTDVVRGPTTIIIQPDIMIYVWLVALYSLYITKTYGYLPSIIFYKQLNT